MTCFIAILALLQWSETKPAISLRCACTWTSLGVYYSPYHSLSSRPQRFTYISHANYIHPISRSTKVSSYYSIKSKISLHCLHHIKSHKSHHLNHLIWYGEDYQYNPTWCKIPLHLWNSRNRSSDSKIQLWGRHRVTVIHISVQNGRKWKEKRSHWS